MTAQQVIDQLQQHYNGNKFQFDVIASQYLNGNNGQQIRQQIIEQVTGKKQPAKLCTVAAVTNALKIKFDQYSLF